MIVSKETANAPARNFTPVMLDLVRKTLPNVIVQDLVSVQTMNPTLWKQLMEGGISEEQLIAEGYEPVSNHRLLWVKKG